MQAWFKDNDYNMKLYIKEPFQQFVLLKTTSMHPHPRKFNAKGTPKKDKHTVQLNE
jgi:hypothetical protein